MEQKVHNEYLEENVGQSCFFNLSEWEGLVFQKSSQGEGHVICNSETY